MRPFADYIYSNCDDTARVRIFKNGDGWDYDYFIKGETIRNFSTEAGDLFNKKSEAKADAEFHFGKLTPRNELMVLGEGWRKK